MTATKTDTGLGAALSAGTWKRAPSRFRDWVSSDGSTPYPAEAGRYHLYVSWACPWAHRTIIGRRLKGLEDPIAVSVVDPIDRKSTRLNSSHANISYAVFCLKKKKEG